jgi:hypothetical protein
MKRTLLLLSTLLFSLTTLPTKAQIKPWSIQAGASYSALQLELEPNHTPLQSPLQFDAIWNGQITVHYEKPLLKWLGFNLGLGLTMRGAGGVSGYGSYSSFLQPNYKRILYLHLPATLQFKLGRVFWWEMGFEAKSPIVSIDSETPELVEQMELSPIDIAAIGGLRLNLSKKVSLGVHIYWGLTQMGQISFISQYTFKIVNYYYLDRTIAYSLRIRLGKDG